MSVYRDIDISFGKKIKSRLIPQVTKSGKVIVDSSGEPTYKIVHDVKSIEDVSAIIRSIKNIVLTIKGERKFNADFGSNLFRSLFENIPLGGKETFLQEKIKEVIGKYEPRVTVTNVKTQYNYSENYMIVDIAVKILETQKIINVPIILQRTR